MSLPGRRVALCGQSGLTGIDFVQVVDPSDQRVVRLFFIIEPDELDTPLVDPATLDAFPLGSGDERAVFAAPDSLAVSNQAPLSVAVHIAAVAGGASLPVEQAQWLEADLDGIRRICLALEMEQSGGFEPYRVTLRGAGIDPFLGTALFDFKQACPTGFDCEADPECCEDELVDVPIDYLARDFHSLRRALLDFAAQRYPDWKEPIEADMATMLLEIMAHLGDEFAYIQDWNDHESRFGSARTRAALEAQAALVDYLPGRGRPAHGEIVLDAAGGIAGTVVPADATYWATGESSAAGSLVPFTQDQSLWVHPAWNRLTPHTPDPQVDCFACGLTELLAVRPAGTAWSEELQPVNLPPSATSAEIDAAILAFLEGRRAMLVSNPQIDRSYPHRSWPVTITSAELLEDPLYPTGGNPTPLLRIGWGADEATPYDLPLDGLSLALNIASVTAGSKVIEFARVGENADIESRFAALPPIARGKLLALPRLIEREGPLEAGGEQRSVIFRHGLKASEAGSLRFDADGDPHVAITELVPPLGLPDPLPVTPQELLEQEFVADPGDPGWVFQRRLLDADEGSPAFTVEPGMWKVVREHHLPTGKLAFADRAGDDGWTVRFGFGTFGRAPADGTILRFDYHTDPGPAANIPSFALGIAALDGSVDPALAGTVVQATNWAPFSGARPAESIDRIKRNAPQAWRANPRRAVRPEDYSAIIERMEFVQRANSVTRWTGSWQTDFVAIDPLGAIALDDKQRRRFAREIDCIRLAARDARATEAEYLDIDIEVRVCVASGFYEGDVLENLRDALAPPGFFAPDNFTFGQPLYRSALEAAAQAVSGVAHVIDIRIRVLGRDLDLRAFTENALIAGPGQIIRLQNDPDRSTLGLIRVTTGEPG